MNANDFPPEFLNKQQAQRNSARLGPAAESSTATANSGLILKDEVYEMVGCAMEVLSGPAQSLP